MTKRILFLALVACLSIGLIAFSLNDSKFAKADYIFSDGFEGGNLSAWTAYAGTLSINTQTLNSGVYNAESIISGSNENLYYHVLNSPPSTIDFREFVYINSTMYPSTSGDYYQMGGFSSTLGPNNGNGGIFVFNSGGALYWGLYYRNNGTFYQAISSSAVAIGWCCVEMQHVTSTGSSANGEEHLWLNGVDIKDVTGISNNDRTLSNAVIGGSQKVTNSSNTWNYYIDDVVVDNSYIGPTPSPSPTPTLSPSPTPAPTSTPTPTPTPTPMPSSTPTPTPIPSSSQLPSPTPTASPTATPSSSNNPTPSPTIPEFPQTIIVLLIATFFLTASVGLVAYHKRNSST